MEIRLIAADMDGTLLDDEKGIPEENLRAFRACASQGIEIVPATGRTMRGLPDELRNLPGVHYAILTNGAQVVDLAKNEIIDSCRIPVALAEKIMMMARMSPDEIMYDVYVGGIGYTMPEFYNDVYKYVSSEGLAGAGAQNQRFGSGQRRLFKRTRTGRREDQYVLLRHGCQKADERRTFKDPGDPCVLIDPE